MSTTRPTTPALPGGRALFPSTNLTPVFYVEGLIMLEERTTSTEYMRRAETMDQQVATDLGSEVDVVTRRGVVDYKEQIEEIKEILSKVPIAYRSGRNHTITMMYYYTQEYKAAKAAYEEYVKSASCYNQNLSSFPEGYDQARMFWLMQWANFPFMEISENVVNIPRLIQGTSTYQPIFDYDSSTVTIKVYVYDLVTGVRITEAQYQFKYRVTDKDALDAGVSFIEGGNLYSKYRDLLQLKFGDEREVQKYVKIALYQIAWTTYVPLTPKITRIDKLSMTNSDELFSAVGSKGEVIPPKVTVKQDSTTSISNGPPPRLSRQNLPDSQARMGRLAGGDLAAQLTARKYGATITSGKVMSVVTGAASGRDQLIGETVYVKAGKQFDVGELVGWVRDVFSEVEGADSVILRKVAGETGTTIGHVGMVIALYKVRYQDADALVLIDFIPNVPEILASYNGHVNDYLRLMACQRNIPYAILADIWAMRSVPGESAVAKWLELMRLENNGFMPIDFGTAVGLYAMYTSFRRKISVQDAQRLTAQRDVRVRNYSQASLALLQYLEDIIAGDRLELSSARDSFAGYIVSANLSISSGKVLGNVEVRPE